MITLGKKYAVINTGFSGIATSKSEGLNGLQQVYLEPEAGGEEGAWFDVSRVGALTSVALPVPTGIQKRKR
jgi:hypothetical protein